MSSNIAIKVDQISKCFRIYDRPHDRLLQMLAFGKKQYGREFWALKDISFEIKKGQTIGIIGKNGSGKSTLLQLICGTLNPTSGHITTEGRIAALLELGSGFNLEFTGRENIYMNATILGLSREEINLRFQDIIDFADIGDFIERPVKTYSSGMLVRLAFAVIAHVDADILVVDEALAVGDAFFTQKCMNFLRTFMKTGTILFVSHDISSIKNLCSHAIWLDKGNLLEQGLPKDICELYFETIYEQRQGKSNFSKFKVTEKLSDDQWTQSNSKVVPSQDLQFSRFKPGAAGFGKGGAQIIDVSLLDEQGNHLNWLVGGEKVNLRITAEVFQILHKPIVGFHVKDRLGQALFGDNSFLTFKNEPLICNEGNKIIASFSFFMPLFPLGDYSISVSIADGSQEEHEQHHWVHNALLFRSESEKVASGLVGIPMQKISLEVV